MCLLSSNSSPAPTPSRQGNDEESSHRSFVYERSVFVSIGREVRGGSPDMVETTRITRTMLGNGQSFLG